MEPYSEDSVTAEARVRSRSEGGRSISEVGAKTALVMTCLVPLLTAPQILFPYVTPKGIFFQAAIAVATTLLLWLAGSRVLHLTDRSDPILWTLGAFVAVSAVTSALGPSPHRSFFGDFERMWGGAQWIALFLFYVLLRTFFAKSDWGIFLRCTLYVTTAVALFAVLEFAFGRMVVETTTTVATLGNSGYLGALMLLAVGVACVVADRSEGPWRWIPFFVVALLISSLLISGNRSSLLGLLGGAAGVLGLLAVDGVRSRAVDLRLIGGTVGTLTALVAVTGLIAPELLIQIPGVERLAEVSFESRSLRHRFEAWKAALAGVSARPLGWGWENFSLVFDRFVDPSVFRLGGQRFDRAHNVLFGKLVQSGPLGLLAYVAFWVVLLAHTVRGWWTGRIRLIEAAGLLVAFTGYFVYLQLWFEDHSSAALLIALAAYLRHRWADEPLLRFGRKKKWSLGQSSVWGGVCLALLAVTLWSGGRSALAAHRMYEATAAVGLEARVSYYESARQMEVPQHHQVAVRYAWSMGALGLTARSPLQRSDSLRSLYRQGVGGAEQALNVAGQRDPMNGRLDAARGRLATGAGVVYGAAEIQKTATESINRAIAKNPPILEHRHFLARAYALFGDSRAAARVLQEVLQVYDGFGRTYYLLAQTEDGTEETEVLRYLRQAFWLGYRPEDRSELRRMVKDLIQRGRSSQAENLLSVYFASHYLPALRVEGDPFRRERRRFFESLSADLEPPGEEYREYEIHPEDLTLLALWPRAAMEADNCERATLAMRLLLSGLSERLGTARIRATLAGQIAETQKRCVGQGEIGGSATAGSRDVRPRTAP